VRRFVPTLHRSADRLSWTVVVNVNVLLEANLMTLTRRRFLAATASAAVTIPFIRNSTAPGRMDPRPSRDPFGGYPIGVQSYSLREFSLTETVRHIQGLGLHFAEFYSKHLPLDSSDEQIRQTLDLLRDADIALVAHGVNEFTGDHEANQRIFEFARRAGIRNITANPQRESFESLDRLCEEFQIRICIHNHGPGALYDKIDDVVAAVKDRHPLFGACIDTGHFIRSAEDPVKAVYELRGRLFALHVKDEAEQRSDSHNVVIGTGHLDLVGLFKGLRETKFPADGSISLEYEAKPENPIEDMQQCIEQAKQAIAKL
jgi:sugar phosphate isomerase/epimerase